jgi:arylsulfatase A
MMLSRILTCALLLCALSTVAAKSPPNVVLIVADDLGWADLGCYDSKYHKTPHLDAFAATAVRFKHAYSACPVCSPTRTAIITGQYPQRLNITDWLPGRPDRPDQRLNRPTLSNDLPATAQTLPGLLKSAGYTTIHVGKWHLGGANARPQDRGFDVNIAGDHTGTPLSYFAPYVGKGKQAMPGLEVAPEGEYLTDRLTAEAEAQIEKAKDKPFFLYLAHYAPHTPMRAKAEKVAKYKANPLGQQGNPVYAAMLESLDESVGRVLKKLDDLKLADNTIVIFTSDNGGLATLEGMPAPPTYNGPLREGKGYLYEGGIRVPLLVRWPGISKAGSTTDTPAISMDLKSTIAEACGRKPAEPADGVSLKPVLEGQPLPARDLYWHYPHYANQGSKPGGAIRSGNFKLIEYFEDNRLELFDVVNDKSESRNLILEKPEVAKEMLAKLQAWRKGVGAKMMTPNDKYLPNPPDKDGRIVMPSKSALVNGVMLRYEPLPHKNTLGFWVRTEDWCRFEFTATAPGKYRVEMLQGCGKGNGGSSVNVEVAGQTLNFVVEDTGHFQNFKPRDIGTITLDKPGRYTLDVKPVKKAAAAVMDLRQVTLTPLTPGG